MHLGFHQAAPVVATPVLPELAPEAPACGDRRIAMCRGLAFAHPGILSWGNDGLGIAPHDSRMHGLGVISAIACHRQKWLITRHLLQQLRQHGSVSDVVGGDTDSPHLQRLCIDADVQLAPLAPALRPMLFALLPAFTQELDACGVNQQVQAG